MGCGASSKAAGVVAEAASPVITTVETGVLISNTGNLHLFGGAPMSYDEDSKTMALAGHKGMTVMDMSDPSAPTKGEVIDTGIISTDGGCDFARIGSTLLLAGGSGIKPIDVSDPKKPVLGECIDTGAFTYNGGVALALNGTTLYAAGGHGVATFDVTDPKAPQKVGSVIDTGAILHSGGATLCINGNYLYVGGGHGLATLDISDPQNPQKVGDIVDTGAIPISHAGDKGQRRWSSGIALAVYGTCLYVLGGKGLSVLDISNPEAPAKVGDVIDTHSTGWSSGAALAVLDNKLLTAGGKGVSLFDLSDGTAPKFIQSMKLSVMSEHGPAGLMVVGPHTYLAGGEGLAVLDNSKIF